MLVVADTSPLRYLAELELLDLLPQLFDQVFVPPEVILELQHAKAPRAAARLAHSPPDWLHVKTPESIIALPDLNRAEEVAINLPRELKADYLLVDEKDGRKAVQNWNLRVTGTLGILEQAAERRLIELRSTFEQLQQTNFHFDRKLADEILSRHDAFQNRAGG